MSDAPKASEVLKDAIEKDKVGRNVIK